MYLFDCHTHTSEVSSCSAMSAEATVKAYRSLGYDGIVITDHFKDEVFQRMPGATWADKVDSFLRGYHIARELGEQCGLTVLFGAEIKVGDYPMNEYLVYGVSRAFYAEREWLYERPLAEVSADIHAAGGMIFQAHPYRGHAVLSPAELLDGLEGFNGNPRKNLFNDRALQTAKQWNVHVIGGADSHQPGDAGHGGMAFETLPKTSEEMVARIRAGQYALVTTAVQTSDNHQKL